MKDGNKDLQAAEYVLGTLSPESHLAVAEALERDRELQGLVAKWEQHFGSLLEQGSPQNSLEPSADLWDRIEAAVSEEPPAGTFTVRAEEGEWIEILPGVTKKILIADPGTESESYLLRLEPGAVLPPHRHTQLEECYVLEGEMIVGKARFNPGDYHAVPAGVPHPAITTQTGALVYIKSEIHEARI